MNRRPPWPYGVASFDRWYKNLTQQVALNTGGSPPVWTHIPKDEADGFVDRYSSKWYAAYSATLVPHVPSVTTGKNIERSRAEKDIRRFIRNYLNHDAVTDAQRIDMELPVLDGVRSTIFEPTVPCRGQLIFPGIGLIEVQKIRPIIGALYDKRSLYGVEIAWGIMPAGKTMDKFPLSGAPMNGSDLPHSVFTRLKRYRFNLQSESGNTFYVCLRYQNAKGEPGPWGPVEHAVIP